MKALFIILCLMVGSIAMAQPNPTLLAQQAQSLEKDLQKTTTDSVKSRLSIELSHAYGFSDMSKANTHADQAITFAKKTKDNDLIVKAILNKCSLSQRQRKAEDAYQLLQEGVPFLKKSNNNTQKGIYYGMIAQIQLQKGNYETALEHYQYSLAAFEKPPVNQDYKAMTLFQIGNVHHRTSNYLQALSYFQQAAILWEKENNYQRLAGCYRNIGNVYSILEEEDKANQAYEKSKTYADQSKKKEPHPPLSNKRNN